jgi:hypothetical protein
MMANKKNKRKQKASTAARPRPRPKKIKPVESAQESGGETADPDVVDEVHLRDTLLSKLEEEFDLDAVEESSSDERKSELEESDEVERFRVGVPDFTAADRKRKAERDARNERKCAVSRCYSQLTLSVYCSAPDEHSVGDRCCWQIEGVHSSSSDVLEGCPSGDWRHHPTACGIASSQLSQSLQGEEDGQDHPQLSGERAGVGESSRSYSNVPQRTSSQEQGQGRCHQEVCLHAN